MAQLRPTFSESWYRVADLKAKLRPSAQISRQHYRGDRWYVVRDPAGNQFHRLSAPAYKFVGLLDGTRTVAEAWELVGGQLADDAPTQNEVIQILSQLHAANLLESNVTPDAAVLLRRHKKQQQRKWQGRMMNILFPRIPLWDPDRFLVRWMPVMKAVFLNWFGAVLWLVVVIGGIAAVAPEWPRLQAAATTAIAPYNWPFLWATFVLIKFIHELGHGFACRRFGGECHEMGIMFLVLMPAPYVDASTAWSFPSKWQRIFVGVGGMVFELFVAAIAAFVWKYTAPGSNWYGIPVNGLAYNTMLIASVSTILFNANPLLRYDGYYILSDWLEIPNLRYRSTEYALGLIKRHVFRVKQVQPLPPVGQRFWLLGYAIASSIYRTIIGIAIMLMVYYLLPEPLQWLGVLMAIGGLTTWLLVPVFKTSKYLLLDPELHRKRLPAIAWTLLFVGTVGYLIFGIRMPAPLYAEGILEPDVRRPVMLQDIGGRVVTIHARHGQELREGDLILTCRNEQLELRLAEIDAQIAGVDVKVKASLDDPAQRAIAMEERAQLLDQRQFVAERLARLELRAPTDGTLVAPRIGDLIGMFLPPNQEVGVINREGGRRVLALIDQDDAALSFGEIRDVAEVRVASEVARKDLRARRDAAADGTPHKPVPFHELPPEYLALTEQAGGKVPVDMTAQPSQDSVALGGRAVPLMRPQVGIWLIPDDQAGPAWPRYVPGQRCYVRFDTGKKPWGEQWTRRMWQLIQSYNRQGKDPNQQMF